MVDIFLDAIKQSIEQEVDKEFTEYKLRCLSDLEYTLELKRNDVVKKILDDIVIKYSEDCLTEPIIQIQLVNKKDKR